MAPVLSFTAELIADCYQTDKKRSIHLQDFNDLSWVKDRLFDLSLQDGPLHNKNMVDIVVREHQAMVVFQSLWDAMKEVRNAVLKSLEELRGQGIIKHSLDAQVQLHIGSDYKHYAKVEQLFALVLQQGQSLEHFLKEYFIVSQVVITLAHESMLQVTPGLFVLTAKAQGGKCARCWQWENFDRFDQEKQLCLRCTQALQ